MPGIFTEMLTQFQQQPRRKILFLILHVRVSRLHKAKQVFQNHKKSVEEEAVLKFVWLLA